MIWQVLFNIACVILGAAALAIAIHCEIKIRQERRK